MRIQKIARGLLFTACCLSFVGGASARMSFLSDYGSGPTAGSGAAQADSSAPGDSAWKAFSAQGLVQDYSPETDTALLRNMRPGETPLQALNRMAKKEKTARIVLGTSMVAAGPILMVGGFLGQVVEEISRDNGPEPELALTLGLVSLGTGIYMLASPWSAERRWKRASEKVLLGIRPDGRGIKLVVRF